MTSQILDVVALSPLQRGLYSVSTMSGPVDPYLVTFAARIENLTGPSTLRSAFDELLARYPHLGAAVATDGLPHPVLVMTSMARIDWNEIDLRDVEDPESAARQLYWDEGRKRIDMDSGPLFRVTLARVAEQDYELICTAHHIVVDGWSIPVLFADLIALHSGAKVTLPPAPPLRDHAAWLAARDADASTRVWLEALAGLDPMPMLASPAEADIPLLGETRLGRQETDEIAGWARRNGLTLNTVLQMAWARVLSGLTGRDDVVFGQTTSGRDHSLPNADRLVGALVTTIPVRVLVDERSPTQIGERLQRDVARLRAHEYVGIAEITRRAGLGHLFDTLLVFENTPVGSVTDRMPMGGGATLVPRRIDSPSHYPVAVVPVVEQGELIVRVEIRPDLAPRFEPDRLARRFAEVVRRMTAAARACDVDIMLGDEPGVMADGDAPAVAHTTVPNALLAAARQAGDRIAVQDHDGGQTFTEFASAVTVLAARLHAAGVQRGDAVAVVLPRDRRVLHAPFAIGLAGALSVHVDPATPADRLAYILQTSGARVVLADSSLVDLLTEVRAQGVPVRHAISAPDGDMRILGEAEGPAVGEGAGFVKSSSGAISTPHPTAAFYVVFTSGTTGRPKGVVVSHGALLNHWGNHEHRVFAPVAQQTGRPLRIGHGWSTGFDAAWQPTVALLSGHTVVLLGDEVRTDAERMVAAIRQQEIDIFDTSPSMLNRLIASGLLTRGDGSEELCPLRVLALGGEAISPDMWSRLRALRGTRVINFYGPTETTVEAMSADLGEHAAPTIGGPFHGMVAEVLDHRLRPVPPGGHGELYLSGPQLAHGYLGRPGATAATFVAGQFGRRYRTGDLVWRTDAGTVVYEGRVDSQVKINGYRVEPDEATAVLRELDGVEDAAALAFAENGRTKLGALVVARRPVAEIRSALARRLPQFLVPTRIVHVDRIPLNRNDKLDTRAAAELLARPLGTHAGSEPGTEAERVLLDVLAAMGDSTARAGILDSLLDLGVDSIGIIDLVSRLRGAGFEVTAKDVLAAADLRELAATLACAEPPTTAERLPAGTVIPLTALGYEIIANGDFRYLSQSQVLTLPPDITAADVADRLEALASAHPTLRSRLNRPAGSEPVLVVCESADITGQLVAVADDPGAAAARLTETVERLDPESGRMLAATLLTAPASNRLLLSVHHLAVDMVSWLILADDLRRLSRGESPLNETRPQQNPVPPPALPLPVLGAPLCGRLTDPAVDRASRALHRVVELDAADTGRLLAYATKHAVSLEDLLMIACVRTFADTVDEDGRVAVTRETHGRSIDDASRQVGWFNVEETVLVPLARVRAWEPAAGAAPLSHRTLDARGQLRCNYLGRFDALRFDAGHWALTPLAELTSEFGVAAHPELPLRFTAEITTVVMPGAGRPVLVTQFDVNSAVVDEEELQRRVVLWLESVTEYGR